MNYKFNFNIWIVLVTIARVDKGKTYYTKGNTYILWLKMWMKNE